MQPGPGYWKMNVSLREGEHYLNELKNNFLEWKTMGINNLWDKRSIWDWLKYKIRNHAISNSKQKAKEQMLGENSCKLFMKKKQRDTKKIHLSLIKTF